MDKEKEIEEMRKNAGCYFADINKTCAEMRKICEETHTSSFEECENCCTYEECELLVDAGYGNVKQAVKEFAEKLKEQMEINGYRSNLHNRIIDKTFKELYGEDL